ncbi:MAG TPA: hypothetical protein PKW90_24700, partial [Myxococcota bacterium]|nr:hypothetical protein [Myxococcota bacterium]
PATTREDFRRLIVDENLLGKRTASNRLRADRYLSQLYGLDPTTPVYRIFRRFWDADPPARPLLAALVACARDPLFRCAAPAILAMAPGEPFSNEQLHAALANVSSSFSSTTVRSTGQNLASSFTQSGHLKGKVHKIRTRAHATPTTAAFAAALGWMQGARGLFLLSSPWAQLLDRNSAEVLDLLLAAGRSGWLDIRSAAGVVEVRMDRLLTPSEQELCHGQSD